MTGDAPSEWLTFTGVARLRGCTRRTVANAVKTRELASVWFPYLRLWLVRQSDAEGWEPRARGERRCLDRPVPLDRGPF